MHADVSNAEQVAAAVKGSDAVVNLVGLLYETKSNTFVKAHVQASDNIASTQPRNGFHYSNACILPLVAPCYVPPSLRCGGGAR